MEAIFTTFGIDWKLLLIQAANFGILLGGLTYFLYKPMMKTLEDRRRKVAQGVLDAQTAEKKLSEIESARAQTLAEAGKEADQILAQARTAGGAKEREILAHAEAAAAALQKQAEAQAQEAKARAIAESKEEVARMIVLGMEKTFAKK